MKNDLVAYINGKDYHVVSGAVYNEEYNETLDSLAIVLDNVAKADRLQIHPYDFVRVQNIGDGLPFNVEMLVDNWVESEENIAQHIYKYQINLMSETKLLEKTQCPNIAITHSEIEGKKDIFEKISQFFQLYVPKVKMKASDTKWAYKHLYELDEASLKAKFQGVPCADMTMQMPTLRQLFTNLMSQVGCIPVIKERKLTYLDLAKEATTFDIGAKGVNKVQRSNSSDSYVNALESQNDQLLDTDNKIISETLGFRDRNNVIIKQTENLKLETSFPIYKVNKFTLRMPSQIASFFYTRNVNYNKEPTNELPRFTIEVSSDRKSILLKYNGLSGVTYHIEMPTIVYVGLRKDQEPTYVNVNNYDDFDVQGGSIVTKSYALPSGVSTNDYMWFKSKCNGKQMNVRLLAIDDIILLNVDNENVQVTQGLSNTYGYLKNDLTQNIVENGKRKLLDTDYRTMPKTASETSVQEVAKWVYGTIGYSIGTKTISGFSQTYSFKNVWWEESKTYFENIANLIINGDRKYGSEHFDDALISKWRKHLGGYDGILELRATAYSSTFASSIFDIEYQPLNSVTFKTYKEETPIEYTQLDGTASGLTDFDRFSKNLQEKVDRLGNEVMSINQTTDEATSLQSLNSDYDDHICFKRTIALANNYVQATYALSKDYVIKNYFTSITTKYRAYEHVDYSQSTLRKEHKNVFVTIDTENHQGESDTIAFYEEPVVTFLKGLLPYEKGKGLRYAIEQGESEDGALETAKYDLSAVTCDNAILLSYESPDNVGAGSYLKSPFVDTDLGGVTQTNQIWGKKYNEKRFVGFVDYLPYYESTGADLFNKACKTPLYPDNAEAIENVVMSSKGEWVQYKDEAERINMSVQLTYVNKASEYLAFTEELLKNMPYIDNSIYGHANAIVFLTDDSAKAGLMPYPNKTGILYTDENDNLAPISDLVTLNSDNQSITFKSVKDVVKIFDCPYKLVHAFKDANGEWQWVDIAMWKSSQSKVLYVYLTDTNTQKIYANDEHNVLRLMYQDDGKGNKGLKSL